MSQTVYVVMNEDAASGPTVVAVISSLGSAKRRGDDRVGANADQIEAGMLGTPTPGSKWERTNSVRWERRYTSGSVIAVEKRKLED